MARAGSHTVTVDGRARSAMAAFATIVVPLMVLLAGDLLYWGTHLDTRGGVAYAPLFTPALVAFALVTACYVTVISSTTLARDQGILKRIRSTPLPPWVYMAGRIVASRLVAVAGAVVVVAVGARLYGFQVIWVGVPAALLTLAVAMVCFCSLGLAVSVLVPRADSAVPIAWGTMLPLSFISDVFQPIDNAPHCADRAVVPAASARRLCRIGVQPGHPNERDPSGPARADGSFRAWRQPRSRCSRSAGNADTATGAMAIAPAGVFAAHRVRALLKPRRRRRARLRQIAESPPARSPNGLARSAARSTLADRGPCARGGLECSA